MCLCDYVSVCLCVCVCVSVCIGISEAHARLMLLLVRWVKTVEEVARSHNIKSEVISRHLRRPEEQTDRVDSRCACSDGSYYISKET